MARIRTQEDFIKKAKEIHGNKYDYSLVDYVVFWDNNLADARAWLEQYRK